jgi:hypothetical protein
MDAYNRYMQSGVDASDMSDDTSIRVSEELADELYQRKGRSTSYEDFIWELLDHVDGDNDAGTTEVQSDTRNTSRDGHTRRTEPRTPVEADVNRLRDELAGSGDLLDRRVNAILDMYEYLVENGEAEKSDLLGAVDVEATGYASADSVWSNMVKGKDTLRSLDGVQTPRKGMTTWRYTDG